MLLLSRVDALCVEGEHGKSQKQEWEWEEGGEIFGKNWRETYKISSKFSSAFMYKLSGLINSHISYSICSFSCNKMIRIMY